MKKRLLGLGLLAAFSLFSTGCFGHTIQHWRANHPCGICSHEHPLLHPLKTRKAAVSEGMGGYTVGPVANSPCHGCGGTTGQPVSLNSGGSDFAPITYPPTIGYPQPIGPGGPTVIPSYELPRPMPLPKQP